MPITWRNIEGDHTRGAASLFETARRALNDGMGNFKSIVDSRNELNQQNWNTQKEVNTDQFLDRLAQYKTPEELAAAQAAGDLQALKAQFGGQIDRDAVRDAEAAQAELLMNRIGARRQYEDSNLVYQNQDNINRLRGVFATGNDADIRAGLQELEKQNYGSAEEALISTGSSRLNTLFDQGMEQKRFGLDATRTNQQTTLFNQQQAEYQRNESQRVANEEANKYISTLTRQMGDSYKDEAMVDPKALESAKGELASYLANTALLPETQKQLVSNFENQLNTVHGLSAQNQGLLDAKIAPVKEAEKIQRTEVDRKYQEQLKNNPFVREEVVDPEVKMDSMITEVNPSGTWDSNEYQELMTVGKEMLGSEMEFDTPEGKLKIQVTPGMVKQALKEVDTSWTPTAMFNAGQALKQSVESMVKAPGFAKRYAAGGTVHEKYMQEIQNIKDLSTETAVNITQDFRKKLFPRTPLPK